MEWSYIVYGCGPSPTPLEQLEGIKAEVKYRGMINGSALVDVISCVHGLYGEIEKLRGQVESETKKLCALVEAQNDIIKVVAGYRSKRDVKTTTIKDATIPGCDVIMSPGETPPKKERRKR